MLTYEGVRTIRDLVQQAGVVYKDDSFIRGVYEENFKDTTFGEFAKKCDAIAAWVAKESRESGHKVRVAIMAPNSCEYVMMMLGIVYGGGICIPMDPQMDGETLCRCFNKAEGDIYIHDTSIKIDEEKMFEKCKNLKKIFNMDICENILEEYADADDKLDVEAQECALILFTSGTTGVEKGVMLSNANIVASAFNNKYNKYYVKLNILPLHHAFCINADIIRNFATGSITCFNGGVDKLGANIQLFQPTLMSMVPRVADALYNNIVMLAKQTGKSPIELKEKVYGKNLKYLIAGGAHLPAELVQKYQEMDIFLCQGYGMTECSPTVASPNTDRPDKAHTAGHIVNDCQTRVIDGELQVKGPFVMMGYVNEPKLTAEIMTEDGWLRTGDMGYVDDEGYLYITGRIKNLIILSNGENVSPEQLENRLLDYNIVEECLVYGEGNSIVAEIYPNAGYIKLNQITNVPKKIEKVINEVNKNLPSHKKIMKHLIRIVPLEKTGSNKIVRNQRATKEMLLQTEVDEKKAPVNELQQSLFEIIANILGHRDFGVDTNIFVVGMDSLGCVLMLNDFAEKMEFYISLEEVMKNPTIELIECLYKDRAVNEQIDFTPRPVYPLTLVQMYFVYTMRNNTTSNIPVLFQLDKSVDLERLQLAITKLMDVHPVLKDEIYMTENGYMNFRDDNRSVNVPIIKMDSQSWSEEYKTIVKPYTYTQGEPLYHINLYDVEGEKFLLFDVAHVISDGTSLSIMLNNINRLYAGENVETEKHTFYDFILADIYRREQDIVKTSYEYFYNLMDGLKVKRSILNHPIRENVIEGPVVGENAALRGQFASVDINAVREYCQKNGISENVYFLTAYNYCIKMYSDRYDTLSTSIHNGRTDSRWSNVSGCVFGTYNFRCTFEDEMSVADTLRSNASQIMETMCSRVSCMHADEMFFQYQGELLDFPEIAGAPAKSIPMQLDSLPFHLIIHCMQGTYIYELRYWKNRFDENLLGIFMQAMEGILNGMLKVEKIGELHNTLPENIFAPQSEIAIVAKNGSIQPVGAWGQVYKNSVPTGVMARILPDGTLDYLEESGRCVLMESVIGRNYANLKALENALVAYPNIVAASAYTRIAEKNEVILVAEVELAGEVNEEELMAYLSANVSQYSMPAKIIYK